MSFCGEGLHYLTFLGSAPYGAGSTVVINRSMEMAGPQQQKSKRSWRTNLHLETGKGKDSPGPRRREQLLFPAEATRRGSPHRAERGAG